MAKATSEDLGSAELGGDLGYSDGETFPPAFEEALAALSEGEVSAPVITEAGVHIIKATEVKLAEKPSFEEYKPMLEARLQSASADQVFIQKVEELRDQVFNAEDLNGPATELGMSVVQSDWLSRQTNEGLLSDARILDAAFSEEVLVDTNNSDVIELAEDHFIVVRVREHQPVEQKPLDDVKDQILSVLKAESATALAKEQAEKLLAQLGAGSSVEALSKETGYEWQVELAATRNKPTLNFDLLRAVFSMPVVSEAAHNELVDMNNGNIAVVQLERVSSGDWNSFSTAEKNTIKNQMRDSYGQQSLSGFVETIRLDSEVETL